MPPFPVPSLPHRFPPTRASISHNVLPQPVSILPVSGAPAVTISLTYIVSFHILGVLQLSLTQYVLQPVLE